MIYGNNFKRLWLEAKCLNNRKYTKHNETRCLNPSVKKKGSSTESKNYRGITVTLQYLNY